MLQFGRFLMPLSEVNTDSALSSLYLNHSLIPVLLRARRQGKGTVKTVGEYDAQQPSAASRYPSSSIFTKRAARTKRG